MSKSSFLKVLESHADNLSVTLETDPNFKHTY